MQTFRMRMGLFIQPTSGWRFVTDSTTNTYVSLVQSLHEVRTAQARYFLSVKMPFEWRNTVIRRTDLGRMSHLGFSMNVAFPFDLLEVISILRIACGMSCHGCSRLCARHHIFHNHVTLIDVERNGWRLMPFADTDNSKLNIILLHGSSKYLMKTYRLNSLQVLNGFAIAFVQRDRAGKL